MAGPMRSTDAAATISVLSNLFTRYGFPEQVVSDNGSPLQSKEYGDFLKLNGIQRVLVSPLPDFIRWRTKYESVNYGISNY